MIDLARLLSWKYPEAEWHLTNNEYSDLVWLSDTPKPTQADLEDSWSAFLAAEELREQAKAADRQAAIAHAKNLGFTDEMIAVMYPGLTV